MPRFSSRHRAVLLAGLLLAACSGGDDGGPAGGADNPLPVVTSLIPDTLPPSPFDTTLDILGQDFLASTEVRVNGVPQARTLLTLQHLRVTVPGALRSQPATLTVQVVNPSPGGGTADAGTVTVTPAALPLPVISGLTPAFAMVGAPGATVTIAGSSFYPGAEVRVNGTPLAGVAYGSPTELTVPVPAGLLDSAQILQVVVTTPAGTSAGSAFEVRNAVPIIGTLGNGAVTAGAASHDLVVTGFGFTPDATVLVDGFPTAATVQGPSQFTVHFDAASLVVPGDYRVEVSVPGPGGGRSNPATFVVQPGAPVLGAALRIRDTLNHFATVSSGWSRYLGPYAGPVGTGEWYIQFQGATYAAPPTPQLQMAVDLYGTQFGTPPATPQTYLINPGGTPSVFFSFTNQGITTWDADSGTVRLSTVAGDTMMVELSVRVAQSAVPGAPPMWVRGVIVAWKQAPPPPPPIRAEPAAANPPRFLRRP